MSVFGVAKQSRGSSVGIKNETSLPPIMGLVYETLEKAGIKPNPGKIKLNEDGSVTLWGSVSEVVAIDEILANNDDVEVFISTEIGSSHATIVAS
jgi:hypothetical protein